MVKRNKVFTFFLALVLSGCATAIKNEEPTSLSSADFKNQGLIVGKISLSDRSRVNVLGGLLGTNFYAYLTRLEDKKVYEASVTNADGFFAWMLRPGTYRISHAGFTNSWRDIVLKKFTPDIKVETGSVVYIGDIQYEVERAGQSWRALGQKVTDDGEKMAAFLQRANPNAKYTFSKQITSNWQRNR